MENNTEYIHKFNIGDEIIVREWHDMAEKFELDMFKNIIIPIKSHNIERRGTTLFTHGMAHLCGECAVVRSFDTMRLNRVYVEFMDDLNDCSWFFVEEMFEYIDTNQENNFSLDEFRSLLLSKAP